MNLIKLTEFAQELRKETFLMFVKKGEAHLGGSFSIIESLVVLYKHILKKK